jgi:hypothetical protein
LWEGKSNTFASQFFYECFKRRLHVYFDGLEYFVGYDGLGFGRTVISDTYAKSKEKSCLSILPEFPSSREYQAHVAVFFFKSCSR